VSDALTLPAARARLGDFATLTKPRVNLLVVATALAGFYMAAGREGPLDALFAAAVGTALVSGGAAALNQIAERDTDALMRRTRHRPVAAGRLPVAEATVFALVLVSAGLVYLAAAAGPLAAAVAGVTAACYVLVYTPLKRRTAFATVVGAVPGALPAVIGWTAARGVLDPGAGVLFAIVFLWQLPHFLAIAWLYRDDYARAGLPMLPVVEPDGRSTGRQAVMYAAALVPASLAPTAIGLTGRAYFFGAGLLGLFFLGLALWFAARLSERSARALFVGSVLYLPTLWILMVAGRA
jgi:protoheme IX farnesyltransferase